METSLKQFESFTPEEIAFMTSNYTTWLKGVNDDIEKAEQTIKLANLLDQFKDSVNSLSSDKEDDSEAKVKFIMDDGTEQDGSNFKSRANKAILKYKDEAKKIETIVSKLSKLNSVINVDISKEA